MFLSMTNFCVLSRQRFFVLTLNQFKIYDKKLEKWVNVDRGKFQRVGVVGCSLKDYGKGFLVRDVKEYFKCQKLIKILVVLKIKVNRRKKNFVLSGLF